jgi:hypothetical protein
LPSDIFKNKGFELILLCQVTKFLNPSALAFGVGCINNIISAAPGEMSEGLQKNVIQIN